MGKGDKYRPVNRRKWELAWKKFDEEKSKEHKDETTRSTDDEERDTETVEI